MKNVRILILLLAASVHIVTPESDADSASENVDVKDNIPQQNATAKPTLPTTTLPTAIAAAPRASNASAPKQDEQPLPKTPTDTTPNATSARPSQKAPIVPTVASTNASVTNSSSSNEENRVNVNYTKPADLPKDKNATLPLTPDSGTGTKVNATNNTLNETGETDNQRSGPDHGTPDSGTGGQPGIPAKVAKTDKRLWWIMLPALLVVAVVAMVLKFKFKKVHDHMDTIDCGTENASFQSRPEKDSVRLVSVNEPGREENATSDGRTDKD